jgi:hypothetical protein
MNLTFFRVQKTRDAAQQCGFAASAGAKQGEELPFFDLQVNIVGCYQIPEAFDNIPDGNSRHVNSSLYWLGLD